MVPPPYVSMNGTALRYVPVAVFPGSYGDVTVSEHYVRDAGHWTVRFREDAGRLLTIGDGTLPDGVSLVPITEAEWCRDNDGWIAPDDV